jgi:two-component system sensor histidine kinase CpxA
MRHRLFFKIFLWFWVAMTSIGAIGIVLALTTDSGTVTHDKRQRRYHQESRVLIQAYEQGGTAALEENIAGLEKKTGHRLFLFHKNRGPLLEKTIPVPITTLIQQASQTHVTQVQAGEKEIWVAYPAAKDYVYLLKKHRPSSLARILDPRALGLRMMVTFIVAGIVCYLLARSLTAPIGRLRRAARTFADGELSTRVKDQVPGDDEIAALACDFDQMAERIEELVNCQHRLMRDISHELRSPLTRVNLALELARQSAVPQMEGPLDRIERETERLNVLIGQLLNLTLLEHGVREMEKSPVDISALIAEIAGDADFEARSRNRRVSFTIAEPLVISGSRELLRQAIENVIRNAVRCTEENSEVTVAVRTERDGKDDTLVIEVRDHGPGVPEEAMEKIFRPFFRTEEARDRQSGGIGLGLAITERAVGLHGGRVVARNAAGGGLKVQLRLPIEVRLEPLQPLQAMV